MSKDPKAMSILRQSHDLELVERPDKHGGGG